MPIFAVAFGSSSSLSVPDGGRPRIRLGVAAVRALRPIWCSGLRCGVFCSPVGPARGNCGSRLRRLSRRSMACSACSANSLLTGTATSRSSCRLASRTTRMSKSRRWCCTPSGLRLAVISMQLSACTAPCRRDHSDLLGRHSWHDKRAACQYHRHATLQERSDLGPGYYLPSLAAAHSSSRSSSSSMSPSSEKSPSKSIARRASASRTPHSISWSTNTDG